MLKSLAIFGLSVAFLLAGPCVAQDQQGKPHAKQDQSQQPAPPTHVIIDPSSATVHIKPEADGGKKTDLEKPWKQFLRPEWVIVYITAFYVVISGLTLWAIKRQADTMETQAKDARVSDAASALTTQATLEAIKQQTIHLRRQAAWQKMSAKAAMLNAQAALESAKASNKQIKMVKDKERARISVSVNTKELEVSPAYSFDVIPVEITNDGTTSAFGVRAKADVFGQPGDDVPYMGSLIPLSIPSVIKANSEPTQADVIIVQDIDLSGLDSSPIPYFFHIGGSVEYEDAFGDAHITTFRFRLKVDAAQPIPESTSWRVRSLHEWERCGTPEENHAT